MTMASVAKHARSFVGTKFVHQGRVPGAGLDCAGVCVCSYRQAGYPIADYSSYSSIPRESCALEYLDRNLRRLSGPAEGAVVLLAFKGMREANHMGIIDGDSVITGDRGAGRINRSRIDSWQGTIHSYWGI